MQKLRLFWVASVFGVLVSSLMAGPSIMQAIAATMPPVAVNENADTGEQSFTGGEGGTGVAGPQASATSGVADLKKWKEFTDARFIMAGVGLRNVGSGEILIHKPTGATVVKAYLYWANIDTGTATTPTTPTLKNIYFNGEKVTGTLIGSDTSPCWGTNMIYIFRADVTGNLARRGGYVDSQYVSIESKRVDAKSPWEPSGIVLPAAESAHLIIVYKDPTVAPTGSDVVIYDAQGLPGLFTFVGGIATFTAPFVAAHGVGSEASVGYALVDGQTFGNLQPNAKEFKWTANPSATTTSMNKGEIYGRDPSITSKASLHGSLSDTEQYNVAAVTLAGDVSGTLSWNFGGFDCLTTVAVAVQG
jgi:hypothetical protein